MRPAAGGGDGALLNSCLFHTLTGNLGALPVIVEQARHTGNAEVQLHALDALAAGAAAAGGTDGARQLLAEADALAPADLVELADRHERAVARLVAPDVEIVASPNGPA